MYKLYIRLHLDCVDVIYYIPHKSLEHGDSVVLTNQMEKI